MKNLNKLFLFFLFATSVLSMPNFLNSMQCKLVTALEVGRDVYAYSFCESGMYSGCLVSAGSDSKFRRPKGRSFLKENIY